MDLAALASSPVGMLVPIRSEASRNHQPYEYHAFIPDPLPRQPDLAPATHHAVTRAATAVARLDEASKRLPDPMLLARPAIRREAVSTSALEGTHAALADVLEADFLEDEEVSASVREVRNYVQATERAFEWIKDGRPITIGLLRELHKLLLRGTPGDTAQAGQVRTIQVYIGPHGRIEESRFVPPPPGDQLTAGLEDWERWISQTDDLPVLVRMALGHYQFETLHPFHDGNGRLGRLVCILQLAASGELTYPVLDLSPWLEARRQEYQDHLLQVSITGRFDPWVQFFCEAVRVQAARSLERVDQLLEWKDDAVRSVRAEGLRGTAVQITEDLIGYPLITVSLAAEMYGVTYVAANNAIKSLVRCGILRERTGRRYNRVFEAPDVLSIIEAR